MKAASPPTMLSRTGTGRAGTCRPQQHKADQKPGAACLDPAPGDGTKPAATSVERLVGTPLPQAAVATTRDAQHKRGRAHRRPHPARSDRPGSQPSPDCLPRQLATATPSPQPGAPPRADAATPQTVAVWA